MTDEDADTIRELARGLREAADRLAATAREVTELRAVVDALVEILAAREVLSPGHRRWFDKLREHARAGGPRIQLRGPIDKHQVAGADIDCQRYLPLCHARCCSFTVALTAADVESGRICWELEQPYLLRHEADGYCAHLDRPAGGGCTIYGERPAACREFEPEPLARVSVDTDVLTRGESPQVTVALAVPRATVNGYSIRFTVRTAAGKTLSSRAMAPDGRTTSTTAIDLTPVPADTDRLGLETTVTNTRTGKEAFRGTTPLRLIGSPWAGASGE